MTPREAFLALIVLLPLALVWGAIGEALLP